MEEMWKKQQNGVMFYKEGAKRFMCVLVCVCVTGELLVLCGDCT